MSSELRDAIERGDLPAVESALASGADVLRPVGSRDEALLRLAHTRLDGPQGLAIVQAVGRAARAAAEAQTDPLMGVRPLADAPHPSSVLFLECEVKVAARAAAELVRAPRREADVAARSVADAARQLYVYRRRGQSWCTVPLTYTGQDSAARAIADVPELEARGEGVSPFARTLATRAGCRVVHLEGDAWTLYGPEGRVERRTFDDEDWERPDATRDERLAHSLAEIGIHPGPAAIDSDGYHVSLGVPDPASLERVDLVVLQELGSPAVIRRVAPVSAPALVGPGGQPPLASAPPAMVKPDEPAPSQGRSAEPPPMVAPDAAPVPVRSPTASGAAPPPSVASAPPPMVTEPVQPNDPASLPPGPDE